MAHLGVLTALDDLGVKVSAISGVSAGAVIGAMYAAGHAPSEILGILKKQSYFSIADFSLMKNGLFTMAGLRKTIMECIVIDDFGCLQVPLFITATDITCGSSVTFSQGELYDVIIASASVPVVFEPVSYQKYQLVDGGILNNLPVEPLLGRCDVIIGSHVNRMYDGSSPIKFSKASLVDQCFHLAIADSVHQRASKCDVFIEPLLTGYGMFEMKYADEIVSRGYRAAMEQKEKLQGYM